MEVWTWILAYVVGFSLLQLLVYRYFRDSDPSVEGSSGGDPVDGDRYPGVAERPEPEGRGDADGDDDGVYCQQCGAYNEREATYRYCKRCVAPLG